MLLARRKRVELTRKLDSLTQELQDWLARSEPGQSLEKHYTQIRRLQALLDGFQATIRTQFPAAGDANAEAALLADCRRLERMILEAHRLWEFFRSKLALRDVTWFRPSLVAADQFAWECYQPVRDALSGAHLAPQARKEPPLVFFNGVASPFAVPRDLAYQLAEIPGGPSPSVQFTEALQRLPVPVIGIPWFQAEYISDMLILGHEVGHCVEYDFRLTGRLEALLRSCGLPPERLDAWLAWRSEVFADVYGTLASGPAFVGSLMDFLALDRARIAQERRVPDAWTTYPTSFLRVQVCLQVLKQIGHEPAVIEGLEGAWREAYPNHAMPEFEADIERVVSALLESPLPELGGAPLKNMVRFDTTRPCFDAAQHVRARQEAERMLASKGKALQARAARILLAAARLAYEQNPAAYEANEVNRRVLKQILDTQESGTRGARGTHGTKKDEAAQSPAQQAAQTRFDADSGADLLALLEPKEEE